MYLSAQIFLGVLEGKQVQNLEIHALSSCKLELQFLLTQAVLGPDIVLCLQSEEKHAETKYSTLNNVNKSYWLFDFKAVKKTSFCLTWMHFICWTQPVTPWKSCIHIIIMSRKPSCKIVLGWGCFIICIIILALESQMMTFLGYMGGVSIWISFSPLKKDLSKLSVNFKLSNGQVTANDRGGGFLKVLLFMIPLYF